MKPDEIAVTYRCSHYEQGRRDERREVIAELTSDRAIRAACVADARRYAEQARQAQFTDEEAVKVYGESNCKLLAAVAASLLAPEAGNDKVLSADSDAKNIGHNPPASPSLEQAREGDGMAAAAAAMAAGIRSLFSSLPFAAPEAVAELAVLKLRPALEEYEAAHEEGIADG